MRHAVTSPHEGKPVERLSEGEWRAVMSWRMDSVERRLDSLFKALVTLIVMVAAGVLVYLLTSVGGGA